MLSEGSPEREREGGGGVGSNGGLKAKAKTEGLWKRQGDVKIARDMKERKANPSGGLQTPPALPLPPLPPPFFQHSTRLCFLSEKSVNVKFSTHN